MTLNDLEHQNRGFYGFYICSQWAFIHALLPRVPFALAGLSCFFFLPLVVKTKFVLSFRNNISQENNLQHTAHVVFVLSLKPYSVSCRVDVKHMTDVTTPNGFRLHDFARRVFEANSSMFSFALLNAFNTSITPSCNTNVVDPVWRMPQK